LATGAVTILVTATKFTRGAWIVVLVFPLLISTLRALGKRHEALDHEIKTRAVAPTSLRDTPLVLYVEALDAATAEALHYVRGFRGEDFRAVAIASETSPNDLCRRWKRFSGM